MHSGVFLNSPCSQKGILFWMETEEVKTGSEEVETYQISYAQKTSKDPENCRGINFHQAPCCEPPSKLSKLASTTDAS